MARRKKYEQDNENHERWLISYADFITLLFAFFVVMYAVSVVNIGKYTVLSEALGDAFGGRGAANKSNTMVEVEALPLSAILAHKRAEAAKRDRERLELLAQKLDSILKPLVNTGKMRVTQTARGVTLEINASALFDEGDATLTPTAQETLRTVADLLKADPHGIEVEGFTDNIRRPRFRSASSPSTWRCCAWRTWYARPACAARIPSSPITIACVARCSRICPWPACKAIIAGWRSRTR